MSHPDRDAREARVCEAFVALADTLVDEYDVIDLLDRSLHAIPLRLRGQAIGVLNLLHRAPGSLPEADLALGRAMADVATIGILAERAVRRGEILHEQLQTTLDNRVIIEQAKGVIAERSGTEMDTAFRLLLAYSRANDLPLADVARRIVAGEIDAASLTAGTVLDTG